MAKISIVMAVYNESKEYLIAAIDSIRKRITPSTYPTEV